ncbi:hypothetical protein MMC13_003690 [Lambiella insularis]|nr:hypothetical protein [Lambiella insularis]
MSDSTQQPANAATQQLQPAPPSTPVTSQAGPVDNLQCQWRDCGDRAASAEQLYEHVCERHVGRKSTNNLCLICAWGTCQTTTVKRDHITSHIRVHVPLKPHKCDFCGKSFKRPQDLKKHVKTHADESVLARSPEQGESSRHPSNGGYAVMSNQPRPSASYYSNAQLPSGMPMNYAFQGHGGNPGGNNQPSGYYGPTAQASAQYGVYYGVNNSDHAGGSAEVESRKRGLDVMDNFFSQVKRQEINTQSFNEITHHLQPLLSVPLPFHIPGGAVADYHPAPMTKHETTLAAYAPTAPSNAYHIDIPNLRTKKDLRGMQVELDTMFDTACGSSNTIAATGTSQHGVHHGINNRGGRSPRENHVLHMRSASPNGDTPELTSGSSVHSNVHSPTSMDFSNGSPPAVPHPTAQAIYPSLPVAASIDTSGAAPSTLGNQFDRDPNRRYSGGRLQKAAPGAASADEMDVDSSVGLQTTSPANVQAQTLSNRMIDPALSGETHSSSDSSTATAGAPLETTYIDEYHVMYMRLLEGLRNMVKAKLEQGDYEEDDVVKGGSMYPDLSGSSVA